MKFRLLCLAFMFIPFSCLLGQEELSKYFDCEGNVPYSGQGLRFSALESKFLTENAGGFRNELKKKFPLRRSMYSTSETFKANIHFRLSPGAQTIILQYHESGRSTSMMLILSDAQLSKQANGVACDGIFDLLLNYKLMDGSRQSVSLGAYRSGESLHCEMVNRCGVIDLKMNNFSYHFCVPDDSMVYFKFGDYFQAKDPVTFERTSKNLYEQFYQAHRLLVDEVIFTDVEYHSFE